MHWYCAKTGEPRYKIPYANGQGEKTPTLADAKKLGFYPSVTSVLGILDKPGLNNWKVEQAILAALTNPVIRDDMPHEQMMAIIKKDSQEQAKKAAEKGTAIHDAIESAHKDRVISPQYRDHVAGAMACLEKNCGPQEWIAEAKIPGGMGYGGKCDLHNPEWVIDYKSKEFTQADLDAKKIKGWPEQHVQLVAYSHGLGGPRRLANLFVSVTEPGLCLFYEWPDDDYAIGLRRWQTTLDAWYAWNDPKGLIQ